MAGLGVQQYSKTLNNAASPGELSDVERLDDFPEAHFRGVTLSLSEEPEASSPNPTTEPRTVATSCLVRTRSSGDLSTNGNVTEQSSASPAPASAVRQFSREISEEETKEYFAVREGAIERAADECSPVLLKHIDGELRGVWLLTEIDHWDTEKERLVFLTDFSLIVLKYDFITLRLLEYRRLHLKSFDKVQIGLLTYPDKSFMPKIGVALDTVRDRLLHPRGRSLARMANCGAFEAVTPLLSPLSSPRNQEGVRCSWNQGTVLPARKEWNPWCREIPWVTFTSHHLCSTPAGAPQHDVDGFSRALAQTMAALDPSTAPPPHLTRSTPCQVVHEPLVVTSYVGLAAAFHNINHLGFFKARGKVSF
ncbi:tumor protein p63-regulated gene 1-like protein isoform X1 [Ixodes scapularis]|uniref:tumor protein p63-regulated gene 1-like protein isoform X1 n=1 Tax=Ixodes scapularis TaxID=6945 RepID=UPI001A9EEA32|nr:tumor protein p63-regulated gene 1-like protein isoform X1 [Ixodes scapularis]